jgi:hypothetical protein
MNCATADDLLILPSRGLPVSLQLCPMDKRMDESDRGRLDRMSQTLGDGRRIDDHRYH